MLFAGAGCATSSPRVQLDNRWPEQPGDYQQVNDRWTRRATLRLGYQEAITVIATLKSAEWRAAHGARTATLTGAPVTEVMAAEKKAAAEHHEVHLRVATWDRKENDLHRGDLATWKVALLGAAGKRITPTKIERDRRPAQTISAEFPGVNDFTESYVAYFAYDPSLFSPGTEAISLRVSSPRGHLDLAWQAP
jgi:hypothetical protein